MLNEGKIDLVVIPGGATGHIQVADRSWNKPIKDQMREIYGQWMDEGPNTHQGRQYARTHIKANCSVDFKTSASWHRNVSKALLQS